MVNPSQRFLHMSGVIGVNVWLTLASYLATHCEPNGLCIGRRVAEGADVQRPRQLAAADLHSAPHVRNDGLVGRGMRVH